MLCGVREMIGDGSAAVKLQTNRPLVYIADAPPGVTRESLTASYLEAFERWTRVANVETRLITDLAEAGPSDVLNYVTTHAHAGQVLADQQLPNGSSNRLVMRVSTRVNWSSVDLRAVLAHEIGHFLGHLHWPSGAPPELMEPVLSSITHPQPTEARVTAGWFGPPKVNPTPTPVPPLPPVPDDCCIRWRQHKQAIYARIPMELTAEQKEKFEAFRQAAAALDCQTIAKALWQAALALVCPPQAK